MSLRMIYGRAGCGKSHFCLCDMKDKLQAAKGRLVLIVPEQFSFQAEKKLVEMLGASGVNGAEVLSFRRLAYRVFSEVGGLSRRHVNPAGKSMFILSIIERLKDQLQVFGKASAQKGFVSILSSTLSELKRYNITPDMLEDIKGNLEEELLRGKLEDLRLIYSEFEKTLHEKFIDTDDDLAILADKLELSKLYEGAEFWIDEFSGFTPQEYRVIEKLLNKAERVNIALCTDCISEEVCLDICDIFAPVRNSAARLLKLAKENGTTVEKPVRLDELKFSKHNSELKHLESCLSTFSYNPYKEDTKAIGLFTAANMYSEVENTARKVLELCREKGLRYGEIAVVTGNLPAYDGLIRVIFSQHGIPFFIDQKRGVMGHPLVLAVLSALHILSGGWSYEAVFRYLKTGLTNIAKADVDLIENYVLANGIRGSRWTRDEQWSFSPDGYGGAELTEYEKTTLARINEIRNDIVTPFKNFEAYIRGRKKCREICTALFGFLTEIGIPARMEEIVDAMKSSGNLELAGEYSQIWNILMEALDQLVEVMGEESLSIERFAGILSAGLEEYKMGLIPPSLEQVLVGSIDRSKNHEVKALFILGVNDGIFPASAGAEGILSDKDRERLRSLGVELAQDTRSKTFEQQLLVYTAMTTASDRLYLSCPVADSEGRTLRPSSVISRLKRYFPKLRLESNLSRDISRDGELEMISSAVPTFNELIYTVRSRVEGLNVHTVWDSVYRWYMSREDWKQKVGQAMSGFAYTNQPEAVTREKTAKLYGSSIYTSISRLEKYAACPFAYYVQYGLKAKERKVFKLEAPDMGTFLHEVLDRFSKRVADSGMNWKELQHEWCSERVSELVEEVVAAAPGSVLNSSPRYKYIAERLKRVLTRAVWLIVEHMKRSGFEPLGYEVAFGMNEALPPITIKLSTGESIVLNGRIDRVDVLKAEDGTYYRIVDYKSGLKSFKLSDVFYGLQLQLVMYMDAVRGLDPQKNMQPAGMLYFRIDDPVVSLGRDAETDKIEKEIMKQLKMKGLLLKDVRLIKEMDNQISGDSLIIPARLNKDGNLGRASAASVEQFELIGKHARRLIASLGEEIMRGNISVSPYKNKKNTPCAYCSYSSICQFDPSLKSNTYRVLKDKKDEEVWEQIALSLTEGGGADGGER